MFVYSLPEQSRDIHDLLLSYEEEIAQELGFHYRVVNIAAGDLGVRKAVGAAYLGEKLLEEIVAHEGRVGVVVLQFLEELEEVAADQRLVAGRAAEREDSRKLTCIKQAAHNFCDTLRGGVSRS